MLPSLADGSMDLDHFFSDLRDTHLRDRHDEHAYLTDTTAGGSQGGLSSNDSSNSLPGDPFVDPLGDMTLNLLDTLPGPEAVGGPGVSDGPGLVEVPEMSESWSTLDDDSEATSDFQDLTAFGSGTDPLPLILHATEGLGHGQHNSRALGTSHDEITPISPAGQPGMRLRSSLTRRRPLSCASRTAGRRRPGASPKDSGWEEDSRHEQEGTGATSRPSKFRTPKPHSHGSATSPGTPQQRGCGCRKSHCLKLYCDCFAVGKMCTSGCACIECLNHSSSSKRQVSTLVRGPLLLMAP